MTSPMTTQFTSPDADPIDAAPRRGWWWPAWAILGVGIAAIAYFRVVGVVDNGTSNALIAAAVLLMLILLGLWTALFSPFSSRRRWQSILGALGAIALFL